MQQLKQVRTLPLPTQLRLAAAALLVVDLFLAWQRASFTGPIGTITASRSGWHGIGVLVGICAIALIAWELARLLDRAPSLPLSADVISSGLAGLTALLAVIEFLTHDQARHWPAWLGLLLAVALVADALSDTAATSRSAERRAVGS